MGSRWRQVDVEAKVRQRLAYRMELEGLGQSSERWLLKS